MSPEREWVFFPAVNRGYPVAVRAAAVCAVTPYRAMVAPTRPGRGIEYEDCSILHFAGSEIGAPAGGLMVRGGTMDTVRVLRGEQGGDPAGLRADRAHASPPPAPAARRDCPGQMLMAFVVKGAK